MRAIALLLLPPAVLLAACRESSIACQVVRSVSESEGLFRIEDPKELPLLQLCWLRDEAAARAAESAEEMLRGEPVDEEPPEERSGTQR